MFEVSEAKKRIKVTIKNYGMEAYINLVEPEDGVNHCDQILQILQENNVNFGVKKEVIEATIRDKRYYIDILVASGVPPKNGEYGFFEFFFEQAVSSKP